MPLFPDSPARDRAVVLTPAITTDQRGLPVVGTPDVGAYEAGNEQVRHLVYREFGQDAQFYG